jgi:hypothetical protein
VIGRGNRANFPASPAQGDKVHGNMSRTSGKDVRVAACWRSIPQWRPGRGQLAPVELFVLIEIEIEVER